MTTTAMQEFVLEMIRTGRLVAYAQEQVDKLAPMLATQYPDIAETDPEQIGAMAKAMVVGYLYEIAFGGAREALDRLFKYGFFTEDELSELDDWRGLTFDFLAHRAFNAA